MSDMVMQQTGNENKELLGEQGNGTLQGMLGEGTDKVLESKIQAEVAELMCPCHATAQVRKIISNAIQQNRNAKNLRDLLSAEPGLLAVLFEKAPSQQECDYWTLPDWDESNEGMGKDESFAEVLCAVKTPWSSDLTAAISNYYLPDAAKEMVALLPPQLHDDLGKGIMCDQHRNDQRGRS